MLLGYNGVRVCGGELCSRYHVCKYLSDESVGEGLRASGNEKDLVLLGYNGVRVCGGELCSRYHVCKYLSDESVGEGLRASGNEKDPYARTP